MWYNVGRNSFIVSEEQNRLYMKKRSKRSKDLQFPNLTFIQQRGKLESFRLSDGQSKNINLFCFLKVKSNTFILALTYGKSL